MSATRSSSDPPPPGDVARASVFVRVAPEDAFEVFTKEIDAWWRTGPKYRIAGRRRGKLFFEGGVGGRMFETFELSTGSRTIEVGKVLAWSPPTYLAFEWRGVNFKPDESTVVEVRFTPENDGTMVSVVHRGWSKLPSDHPARHGLEVAEFVRMMAMWWGGLLTGLREHVAER